MFSDMYAAFVIGQLSLASAPMVPVVVFFAAFMVGETLTARWVPESGKINGNFGFVEPSLFLIGFGLMFILNSLPATYLGRLVLEYRMVLCWSGGLMTMLMGRWMLGLALTAKPRRVGKAFGAMFFFMGMGLAAVWHPKTGVLLNSILVFAASAGNLGPGLSLLTAYSLGLIFPFIFIGLFLSWFAGRIPARRLGIRVTLGSCGGVLLVFGALVVINRLFFLTPGDWALYSY